MEAGQVADIPFSLASLEVVSYRRDHIIDLHQHVSSLSTLRGRNPWDFISDKSMTSLQYTHFVAKLAESLEEWDSGHGDGARQPVMKDGTDRLSLPLVVNFPKLVKLDRFWLCKTLRFAFPQLHEATITVPIINEGSRDAEDAARIIHTSPLLHKLQLFVGVDEYPDESVPQALRSLCNLEDLCLTSTKASGMALKMLEPSVIGDEAEWSLITVPCDHTLIQSASVATRHIQSVQTRM